MAADALDARKFRDIAVEHPQNAGLFGDDVLAKVLSSGASLAEERDVARGELLVRMLLKWDRYREPIEYETKGLAREFDARRELCGWLGEEFLLGFLSHAEACGLSAGAGPKRLRVEGLFKWAAEHWGSGDATLRCIEEMVRPWVEADGVIPVYKGGGGYLLPFSFVEEGARPAVCDYGGNAIEPWTEYFGELVRDYGIHRSARVAIWQDETFKATGRSLMLPVLAAWNRRYVAEEVRLPYYHPLRFIMTGDITGGRVKGVECEAKEEKIGRDVKDGRLAYPGMKRGTVRIWEGAGVGEALESLRQLAEREWASSVKCAARRLGVLDFLVRKANGADWDGVIERLDRLGEGLHPLTDPKDYLNWLMLRSAARCHAGRTGEAHEINRVAMEFARKRPKFAAQLLRLQIEELVLLQDKEEFGKVFEVGEGVEKAIGDWLARGGGGKTGADLLMRYHGTMGQAKAYAVLSGKGKPEWKAEARKHLETALERAAELSWDNEAYVADCCQDANYLVLWEALFGGDGVVKAAEDARGACERLRSSDCEEGAAGKNDKFRHRFEALARYRAALEGRGGPEFEREDMGRELVGDGGWVEATIRKYEGAVAAKAGDLARARELFEGAAGLMERYGRGILGAIRMSVHAEAYRSLRGRDGEAAERHRREALRLLGEGGVGGMDGWREWLEGEGGDGEFPGLRWWY